MNEPPERPLAARFRDGEFGVLLPPAWTPYLLLVLQAMAREFREKGTWIPAWFIDLEEATVQAASGEVRQAVDLRFAGASARGTHPAPGGSDAPEFMTSEQVAVALGVSDRWVRELCRLGRFEGARRVGRTWAVPEALIRDGAPRRG